jgi:hypothetical protein
MAEDYSWEYKLRKATKWIPCTTQDKEKIKANADMYSRFNFRAMKAGTPTKNSVVTKPKKKAKKVEE